MNSRRLIKLGCIGLLSSVSCPPTLLASTQYDDDEGFDGPAETSAQLEDDIQVIGIRVRVSL